MNIIFNISQIVYTIEIERDVKCFQLKIMGVYCTIVFISSLVLNSMHLYVYLKNKRLRTPNNFFHLALTILNLFASCTELPMVMISAFNCR